MNFNDNIGTVDRALRLAVGLGLIVATVLGFIGAWGWIGVIPLVTAVFSFCPLYILFKFTTVEQDKR